MNWSKKGVCGSVAYADLDIKDRIEIVTVTVKVAVMAFAKTVGHGIPITLRRWRQKMQRTLLAMTPTGVPYPICVGVPKTRKRKVDN